MSDAVPFLSPTFPTAEELADDYRQILANGIFSNSGPFARRFAAGLEAWLDGAGASVVSSGTAGLELTVEALFDRTRPSAIVASFTFAAGPLVLVRSGFRPLFIDVDRTTWQPSLDQAASLIASQGESVGGILLTSTLGVADGAIDGWEELAASAGIPLVVDAAAGFGGVYPDGRPAGTRGACEVFSFHATKTLAIGEGGAVVSRRKHLIEEIDRLKNFGFDDQRNASIVGTNAKLPELAAAIGLRQLDVLADRMERRRAVLDTYYRVLGPLGFEIQPGLERSPVVFVSALAPEGLDRDDVVCRLAGAGIECRTYYNPPVHRHGALAPYAVGDLPVTDELSRRVISFPTSDHLDERVVERIASVVCSTGTTS